MYFQVLLLTSGTWFNTSVLLVGETLLFKQLTQQAAGTATLDNCPSNTERFPGKLIILKTILSSLNSAVGITQPRRVREKSSGKEGVRISKGGGAGKRSVPARRIGGEKGEKIEGGSKCADI
jgi:hypothetical protein